MNLKAERREQRARKRKARMPTHGSGSARLYWDAIQRAASCGIVSEPLVDKVSEKGDKSGKCG